MKKLLKNSFLFSFLCITILQAQTEKLKIKAADYNKWGKLQKEQISPDGHWISFYMKYENGLDTLYLKNPKIGANYVFPQGTNGTFSTDGKWFTLSDPKKGLGILNLAKDSIKWIPEVEKFDFLPQRKAVVVKTKGRPIIKFVDLITDSTEIFENVNDFIVSPQGAIAVLTDKEVKLISFSNNYMQTSVLKTDIGKFKNIIWNSSGSMLAFLEELSEHNNGQNHKIYCYSLENKKLFCLDPSLAKELEGNRIVSRGRSMPIIFSPTASTIFFNYAGFEKQDGENEAVETWDTSLPLDYPEQKYLGNPNLLPKIATWNLTTGTIKKLGTNELPNLKISIDRKTALAFNNLQYEPQFVMHSPVDLFLIDTETLSKALLIEKQDMSTAFFSSSPDAAKLAYFRLGNWWIYDRIKKTHINASLPIQTPLINKDDYNETYGAEGWSTDNKFLIIYDKFDIWLVPSTGEKPKRITNGRENGIQYRIAACSSRDYTPYSSINLGKKPYDISEGLILEAHALNKDSGYAIWKPNKKLQWIIYGPKEYSNIHKASKDDYYILTEQTANIPPRIMYWNPKGTKANLIYQSNPHYSQYHSGKVELISYSTDSFSDLHGLLYYPIGFNPAKKYPMVVYIYQKLSDGLHHYVNPTFYTNTGFNIPNFTNDGYIVLLPDIRYNIGEPGKSALDCTTAAVNEVSKKGFLKQHTIGLIGHSFGGYETSYIITQTNLFAAAVAGAAITDLISNYFSMHWDVYHSTMWSYEAQQLRMGKTPFDDYNAYLRNSPIAQAATIETPLLSWSGKDDITVNWNQSLELYLALRRLKKKNQFLVYPGEGHLLVNPKNQIDLSNKVKDWFDKILKVE
jgi:dienelactone hydrolase